MIPPVPPGEAHFEGELAGEDVGTDEGVVDGEVVFAPGLVPAAAGSATE
jgi:hypothetical protein